MNLNLAVLKYLLIALAIIINYCLLQAEDSLLPGGYDIVVDYQLSSTDVNVNDTLTITRTIVNNTSIILENLYLGENLPPEFEIMFSSIIVNNEELSFYYSEELPNGVILGFSAYHWTIDDPAAEDSLNHLIHPGDTLILICSTMCNTPGQYTLPLHTLCFCGQPTCFIAFDNPLIVNVYLNSDPGFLEGIITDNNLNPIENAHVVALNEEIEDYSNSDGQYLLDNLSVGTHDITFTHPEYNDTTILEVAIFPNETTSLDIILLPFTGLFYLPGDVNMYNGQWPPEVIGSDVTYLVNYFRDISPSQPCNLDGFWASADANGDCDLKGSDVTRIVNYFRGAITLSHCPDYEPMWLTPDDLPAEAPEAWPNCGELLPNH